MREWVSLNGQIMPAERAVVSVFDSGFMQGIGLFETMRAYHGQIFRLEDHLSRLQKSAQQLGWTSVPDGERLRNALTQVVSATDSSDVRVRLTVTTGSLHVSDRDEVGLTVVANATPGAKYAEELYARGVTVVESRAAQSTTDPTVGHKTTSYFARLAVLREAHARGAFESLWYTDKGELAEGSISSVFLVEDEVLLVPPLETPVLPGITRRIVLELAKALEIPVRQHSLTREEVEGADEMFLTNSLMEVLPVVRVDRRPIGGEKPGEVTRRLADAYRERVREECELAAPD